MCAIFQHTPAIRAGMETPLICRRRLLAESVDGELLDQLEFADTADIPREQLRDYAVMALQDLEDDEAAGKLLNHVFGKKLSAGKIQVPIFS